MASSNPSPHAPPFRWSLLWPRWWPTWSSLGLVWCLSRLPIDLQLALGESLGRWVSWLVPARRRVVDTNLRLCFPELDTERRNGLVNAHFAALGRGLFETGLAWFASDQRLAPRFAVEGREHLDSALESGQGLLLLTGHFTTLEIGARVLCTTLALPFHAMYRPYDNPVMDFWMHRLREKWSRRPALPRDDIRRLVRALREGQAVWYAPDQTIAPELSVYAPFFGVPALSLTATSRLARMGRARVLPYFPKHHDGVWTIRFQPVLEDFPAGDEVLDATRINAVIESGIRPALSDYFWIHRRFKKRPKGESKVY